MREAKEVDAPPAGLASQSGGLDESMRPTCQTPGCDVLCHAKGKTGWFTLCNNRCHPGNVGGKKLDDQGPVIKKQAEMLEAMQKQLAEAAKDRRSLLQTLQDQNTALFTLKTAADGLGDKRVEEAEIAKTRYDIQQSVQGQMRERRQSAEATEKALRDRLAQLEKLVHPANLAKLVKREVGSVAAPLGGPLGGVGTASVSYVEQVAQEASVQTQADVWSRLRQAQVLMAGGEGFCALPQQLPDGPALSDKQVKAREEEQRIAAELRQRRLLEKNLDTNIGELTPEQMMLIAFSLEPNRSGYHGVVEASRGIVVMRDLCTRTLKDFAYEMERVRHNNRLHVIRLAATGKKMVGAAISAEQGALESKVAVAADPKEKGAEVAAFADLQLGPKAVVLFGATCGAGLTDPEVRDALTKVKLSQSVKREMNKAGDAFLMNVAATKVIMLGGNAELALKQMDDAEFKLKFHSEQLLTNVGELFHKAHDRAFDWGVLAGAQTGSQRHLSNLYREELYRQDMELCKLLRKACGVIVKRAEERVGPGKSKKDRKDVLSGQKALAFKQCRRYIFLHLLIRAAHEVAVVSTDPDHIFMKLTAEGTFEAQTIDRVLKTTKWDSKQL
jgi:hypothetical protein